MDDTLLARLADDVDGSFEAFVLAEQHFVFGVALRLTLDRHDAEEVAQEAFVRAYRALTGYEPERIRALRPRPWLAQITLNVQRNRVRRRRDVVHGPPDLPAPTADGPEERAEAADARSRCAALVASLPEPYRVAVALRHIEGLSYAEVADALDRPVGTVKAQVHRAVAMLREKIDEEDNRWRGQE